MSNLTSLLAVRYETGVGLHLETLGEALLFFAVVAAIIYWMVSANMQADRRNERLMERYGDDPGERAASGCTGVLLYAMIGILMFALVAAQGGGQ